MGDKNPFLSLDDGPEDAEAIPAGPISNNNKKKKSKKAPPPIPSHASSTTNPFNDSPSSSSSSSTNPFNDAPSPPAPAHHSSTPSWSDPPASNSTPSWADPPPPPVAAKTNPFSQQASTPSWADPPPPPHATPSTNPFSQQDTSAYSKPQDSSGPSWAREDNLNDREARLNKREQDLNAREKSLADREAKLGKIDRVPNWPVWPKPFLFHSIITDIPADKRALVRQAYGFWFAKLLFTIWNLVVDVALLIVHARVGDFVLGIVYIFIWNIFLFLNYRLLYNACRRGRALTYAFFLFWFALEILVFIFWLIGLHGSGMTGILWMLWCFSNSQKTVGFMCLVNIIFCAIAIVYNSYIWYRARQFYAQSGGSKSATTQAAVVAGETAAQNPEIVVQGATHLPYASKATGY